MRTMLRVSIVSSALLFLVCCTSGGGLGSASSTSSSSSSSGAGTVSQGFCYVSSNGLSCDCVASDDDANRSSTEWTKVTTCDGAVFPTGSGEAVCFADTKLDGSTTTCSCQPLGCRQLGGDYRNCTCGALGSEDGEPTTACTGSEWYCGADDGSHCYAGNGNFGSACGNEEHTVSSCALSDLKLGEDQRSSCAGLRFVAPPPSTSSSGGSSGSSGCSGCQSDSDCHDKCKRCDRTTCSCVSRLSC